MASVGRIVHYSPDGIACWAAIVRHFEASTWVQQDTNEVSEREAAVLLIIPPAGDLFTRTVFEGASPGSWHWPERVE